MRLKKEKKQAARRRGCRDEGLSMKVEEMKRQAWKKRAAKQWGLNDGEMSWKKDEGDQGWDRKPLC